MSTTTVTPAPLADRLARSGQRSLLDRPAVVIALGFALCLALSWPRLLVIWTDNTFFDTDDAMRLVEVRNWLGGQGWFDLTEHRLFPPAGLLMHWSRVVDVPVGALIRLFELVEPVDGGERLARIVFPLLMQLGLIAVAVHVGRLLAGPAATVPVMVLTVLSGFTYEQFPPGRIDHHAPQIVLLLAMTLTVLASLDPRAAGRAGLTGLCIAASLAISLENLPFIAVLVAILPLVWVFDPMAVRRSLLWLALGLAVGVPALFAATIPPSRYLAGACDALSTGHLIGAMAGAAGLAALSLLTDRLRTPLRRTLALGLIGTLVAACVLSTYPACLHDPYAGMDPALQRLWLSHVTEAQPLLAAARARPDTATMLFLPLVAGALGLSLAVWRERGLARRRWAAVLALTLMGLAGTLWEVRVASSSQPLALLGGVWVVTAALERARRAGSLLGGMAALLLVPPFATLAWAFVPVGPGDAQAAAELLRGQACRTSDALKPLAALPPGLVFAPIDDGSHLLAMTPHSVLAAPYHRNQIGNRRVIDGFMAPADQAEAIVRASGARYVAICPGEVGISVIAQTAPDGLGARLAAGDVPAWLRPVVLQGTPYRVFELR